LVELEDDVYFSAGGVGSLIAPHFTSRSGSASASSSSIVSPGS
jgi:hypothetical protein